MHAGLVAAATGAALLCENAFARLDRGMGLPSPARLPYFPQEAAAALAKYDMLVVVGTRRPVANFGYRCAGAACMLLARHGTQRWACAPHLLRGKSFGHACTCAASRPCHAVVTIWRSSMAQCHHQGC